MVAEILTPGMKDGGNSQGSLEVVAAELQQGRGGAGEQEGVEAGLVVPDERVQFVRQRKNDVEVRDGQQVLGLLLQPLGAFEVLATGTMAVAARVRHEVFLAAMGTPVLVATQRWRVTGGDGVEDLPMMGRQTVRLGQAGQTGSHNFTQGNGLRRTGPRATGHRSQGLIALPGPAKIDQIQCTADLVQPFLTNMEISGRGRETAMAQQSLEAERVDASFQQMRGKTVAQ